MVGQVRSEAANTLQNGFNSAIGDVNSALGNIPDFRNSATIPIITINTPALSNVSPPDFWSGSLRFAKINVDVPRRRGIGDGRL